MSAWALTGAELEDVLEHINVPSYLVDTTGVIRWVNPAAKHLVGDVVGYQFTSVVAPREASRMRNRFASRLLGTAPLQDTSVTVLDKRGQELAVELSSVSLVRGGRIVGIFGQAVNVEQMPEPEVEFALTPRQREILHHLEQGMSTAQIAEELHLSRETVRNHVRSLLRAVGARSRLEAVAVAHGATPRTPSRT